MLPATAEAVTLELVKGEADEAIDDRTLVELARTQPEAFAELYRRYVPRVFAFAYRRTSTPDVAEDITSATFERALRSLGGFTWRRGGFGAWIFRIAANELVDHYRRVGRATGDRARGALDSLHGEHAGDPADEVVGRDAVDRMLDAMNDLSPRYQQALSLRYLSGLTAEEAAAAMGTSRATMAVIVFRATRALRRAMTTQDSK